MNLSDSLLHWYSLNHRHLPWRGTRDPYKIWLSEVILQQTRVIQGTSYYHRFLQAFPDVQSLALADEQQVLKLWQGLGYYSRARNMHFTAKVIAGKHNGNFPSTAAELLKLKGIGDYTAAAIASICFNEAVPVLDGNVARVVSRIFAVKTSVDSNAGRAEIKNLAAGLMNQSVPGQFNQAIMELGALICTPKNPDCKTCPVSFACLAFANKNMESFPVKAPKKLPVQRFLNYIVLRYTENNDDYIIMRHRTSNDIWKNMYDFPCIESENATDPEVVIRQYLQMESYEESDFRVTKTTHEYIHKLTHRTLVARFIVINLLTKPREVLSPNFTFSLTEIENLPVPRLIDMFLLDEIIT